MNGADMTDCELLELAGKACGYTEACCPDGWTDDGPWRWHEDISWNPLKNDGDALRLAVKLGLKIETPKYKGFGSTVANQTVFRDCPYEQTRRAIVRAAAEIGKAIP